MEQREEPGLELWTPEPQWHYITVCLPTRLLALTTQYLLLINTEINCNVAVKDFK